MKIKLLVFLLVIFSACGRKNIVTTESVLKIDLLSESRSKVNNISEFATNIEYIPLQTTENSLIGNIVRKIVNVGENLYVQSSEEILCFDIEGKFLFKIEKRGRGPEEYTFITDFDISSDNKILTILSSSNRKLLTYGISDTVFTFQRSISLSDPIPYKISILPETDKIFLAIPPWRGTEPTLSLLINTAGDTIHFKPNCYKYKMVRKTNYMALNEMLVYSIGNMVCFKEEFSDTVFYVDAKDNFFKPRMIFDSHGSLGTHEVRGGSETPGNNITSIANIFETSRYVFYWFNTIANQNCILFDKENNMKYKLDIDNRLKTKIKDDLSGGPDFNIEFLNNYCSGGKLFSFVEAIALKKYIEGNDFKNSDVSDSKKGELKKMADSLKETDNPVLVIVTLKN